jgi:hypothetical protein
VGEEIRKEEVGKNGLGKVEKMGEMGDVGGGVERDRREGKEEK